MKIVHDTSKKPWVLLWQFSFVENNHNCSTFVSNPYTMSKRQSLESLLGSPLDITATVMSIFALFTAGQWRASTWKKATVELRRSRDACVRNNKQARKFFFFNWASLKYYFLCSAPLQLDISLHCSVIAYCYSYFYFHFQLDFNTYFNSNLLEAQ